MLHATFGIDNVGIDYSELKSCMHDSLQRQELLTS